MKNCSDPTFPFFPTVSKGETVYSVLSRCAARSGLPNTYLTQELTGQRRTIPLLSALPGYLRKIAEHVPIGHSWRDPVIIAALHTGLPYFTYFDNETDRNFWRQSYLKADQSNPVSLALGLTMFPCGSKPPHPRFCPSCAQEDKERLGFSYFYREHQLPGVAVCGKHEIPLGHGCINCGPYPIKGMTLRMAGTCGCDNGCTPLPAYTEIPDDIEPIVWLAKQSTYLVNSAGTSYNNIRQALRHHALEKGLGNRSVLNPLQLSEAIEGRFGDKTLEWLNMPAFTNGKASSWVRRLLNPSAEIKRSPALYYLLVIGALFDSVADFENSSDETSGTHLLEESQLKRCSEANLDPSTEKEELTKRLWILLQDGNCGLPGISSRLGIPIYELISIVRSKGWRVPLSQQTRKKLGEDKVSAIRSEVKNGVEKKTIMSRHGCSEWAITLIELDSPRLNTDFRQAMKNQTKNRNRSKLESYLESNPTASRTDVMTDLSGVYDYLMTHDKDWFYEKIAEKKKPANVPRKKRINWKQLDRNKAKEVEKEILSMLSQETKPEHATKTAILKKVHIHRQYANKPANFPMLTKALEDHAESRVDFIQRRLAWAINEMACAGTSISVNKLRRVAGLSASVVRPHRKFIRKKAKELNAAIEATSFFSN